MKKTLLFCAAVLFSLMASAGDGLVAVGANVILLPSSRWDGDIEWKAWTWVYNSGQSYGDWNSWNANYNQVLSEPVDDAEGRHWTELGFDMGPKYNVETQEGDINFDTFEPIDWEEHTAPFSSDETYNGKPSYQWTTNSIMADIYVRRIFTTDLLLSGPVYLACGHDDAPAEYYINGVLVFERTGFEGEHEEVVDGATVIAYDNAWNNDEYILLTDEQKALINLNGEENVLAFHVHQNWGGAFADCGLYTKIEGGLDMGYTTPWEGKVLFNNTGGYNRDGQSPSNNPKHPWSALYEAQEGDEYTFTMPGGCPMDYYDIWQEQLHFKTPIKIEEGHTYTFKARLLSDKPFENVVVKLTDNDDDDIELAYEDPITIDAPEEGEENYEGTLVEIEFDGQEVNNFKIVFDFGGGEKGATVTIKDMSLIDQDPDDEELDQKELWVGTHYFNYFHMTDAVVSYIIWDDTLNDGAGDYRTPTAEEIEQGLAEEDGFDYVPVDAPEITGRVETLAWTQADFDDSMWDDQMMPTGSANYMPEQQSIWPSGILEETGYSSNYWIRRTFELEKINDRLSYELNVCHDDVYETYVNGVLLQKNVGWTNGKSPVQVHIPARYLNVGKNVIATYIQQNWGGYFYDCGINVTEVNYDECLKLFNDALAYAETDTLLTNRMHADVKAIVERAKQFFQENKNDAAELRAYARDSIRPNVNAIFAYSADVKILKDTWNICRKMEDKGYWGTALEAVTAALDTCATPNDLNKYLEPLRDARKATAMERHTEKYVGCKPQAVQPEEIGLTSTLVDPMEDSRPKYYIYNVGAKNFLGAGETWGTHLAIEYISSPMMLVKAAKFSKDETTGDYLWEDRVEGAYFFETFRPNGSIGEMDFMGWNGFIDCGLSTTQGMWELIPVEGKTNVYNIAQFGTMSEKEETTYSGVTYEPGCKRLLGLRSGDNGYAPSYYVVDTDMHDPNLETNQWMFISREELLGLVATASVDNPVDLSFLIRNPGYDQRWTIDYWAFTNGSVFGRGADHANFVFEAYDAEDFWMAQDLWPEEGEEALPAGTYMLEVQGYYRDGNEGTHVAKVLADKPVAQRAIIFAGAMEESSNPEEIAKAANVPLAPIHVEANQVPGIGYGADQGLRMPGTYGGQPRNATDQAGMDFFPCGLYMNRLVFTLSEENCGNVSIGIFKDYDETRPAGDWCVMDNWRIKYYGGGEIDPDAIKGITTDEIKKITPASKGIYNMLGQRLSKTQKGLNIINGKKVIKK